MAFNVFGDCTEVDHVEYSLQGQLEGLPANEPASNIGVMQELRRRTTHALEASGLVVTEVDKRLLDPDCADLGPLRTAESVADRWARIRKKAVEEYAKYIGLPKGSKPPKLPDYIEQLIIRHQSLTNQFNTLEEALIELRGELLRIRIVSDLQKGGLLLLSRAMWRLAANEQMTAVHFRDTFGKGKPKGSVSDVCQYLRKIITDNPEASVKDLYHKIAAAAAGENGCPWDEYTDGVLYAPNGKGMKFKTFQNQVSLIKNPKAAAPKVARNKTKNPG